MENDVVTSAPVVSLANVEQAARNLKGVIYKTLLQQNLGLSQAYGATIYLKREDLQVVRSYKIRGAYNKISTLTQEQGAQDVVCASAGNHAQGVAYACQLLGLKGYIFMPANTPAQKVNKVRLFGKDKVEVMLTGNTFDDTFKAAKAFCDERGSTFVHPFDDLAIVEGQATVGLEILKAAPVSIDYCFMPIGGGGLASGVGSVFRQLSPHTKLIGVQPLGAPSMQRSIQNGQRQALDQIESFVDGAAVKCPGELTFELCRQLLDDVVLVPEGQVCEDLLKMYNEEGIVLEPAGTLSISALHQYADEIKGKNVVCVVSGSNNDITRMEDIKERAMQHQGLKHYFMVTFNQRPGALRSFVNKVLHPDDDIIHFQYIKKNNKEKGPVFIGIEVKRPHEIQGIQQRMLAEGFAYEYLNGKPDFLSLLV
ncbi:MULTISPECIES: threonine ammonia-lyase IlvA [Hymenobacter]|uniref:L-threonine dehydratase n=1 Tax=Hymenobacter jejuensis TaxID=2502781 RepID=A0A5B8A3B3_9BACT|nr:MULTISPECIES: threonine ammonia-lyase IlvA [Hymenobacter]MBC6989767.1 threonine ammonia-lyase IlvA [Hymenobacter sp. BT491]QDA61820.1 threonine ammonia-lyase IlvA [Hymenobacter jejuensis]